MAAGVADRCTLVGGDFFVEVPAGGDAYVLSQILHDWDDERCVEILEQCRRAMPDHGKLLVVELVLPPRTSPSSGSGWICTCWCCSVAANGLPPNTTRYFGLRDLSWRTSFRRRLGPASWRLSPSDPGSDDAPAWGLRSRRSNWR